MAERTIFGYVRVSSVDQNEDRQIEAMYQAGVKSRDIYMDKQSGKDFLRPGYLKMLKKMKQGDLLFIMSIGWDVIIRKCRNNGEYLQKRRGSTYVLSICRCWTRAEEKI